MDSEFNNDQNPLLQSENNQNEQLIQPSVDPNTQQYAQPAYQQPLDQNAQQYAQPPYQQPYDPIVQQYGQPPFPPQDNYSYAPYGESPEKKSHLGLLLGIIIALLVAIIGVLSYLYFVKGSDKDSGSDKTSVASTEALSTEATQPSTEEDTTEATTESETTTTTTTTAPHAEAKAFPNSDISKYPQYKEAVEKELSEGLLGSLLDTGYHTEPRYALIDLNDDGTPEFVSTIDQWSVVSIFAIVDNKVVQLTQVGGAGRDGIMIYPNGRIIHSGSGGASTGGGTCYIYEGGNQLTELYGWMYEYNDNGTTKYTLTENGVTKDLNQSEFNALNIFGDPFEPVSAPIEDMGVKYTKKAKETYLFKGYVATESDALNMRETPDANGKIITQLPKGSKGDIYTIEGNSEWYKIYPEGRGDSGYVSAKYIKEYIEAQHPSTNTPYGNFTYTNYDADDYDYKYRKFYDPSTLGISVSCDLSEFNSKHTDYRIDNVYFKVGEGSGNKPHDYRLFLIYTGTMLNDKYLKFRPSVYLKDNSTGEETYVGTIYSFEASLYSGETFCYDGVCDLYSVEVRDNASYTLVFK